ncbi:MAG TPA: prephenate dehydrogenase [bacterium]|nr:prephenate dehydrogenase [bacterium]
MFRKVVIVGVGQIGASLGMNLIARKMARDVVGIGRDPENLRVAMRKRAIHRVGSIRELPLQGPDDLIILAAPVRTIRDLLKKMPKGPLIIDVGSTKAAIVSEAKKRSLRFIGCHPIAGTERPGAAGAEKDLFRGRVCVVTPSKGTSPKDAAAVAKLWKRLGSSVLRMAPEAHDRALAAFSHLPHVIAYSLIAQSPVASVPRSLFAGLGSFRSTTRVAASEPTMWRDIFLENRKAVLAAVGRQAREFAALKKLIAKGDADGLLRYLSRAQAKRRSIP